MLRSIISCVLLLLATTAVAQNPFPRQGNSCPTGTHKSRDHCKPVTTAKESSSQTFHLLQWKKIIIIIELLLKIPALFHRISSISKSDQRGIICPNPL